MTDTENFKKIIAVLCRKDTPKNFRPSFDYHGRWYNTDANSSREEVLLNLDYGVDILVNEGDYGIAVWSECEKVRKAWVEYHERMLEHYLGEIEANYTLTHDEE